MDTDKKVISANVIKKNRVYFAITVNGVKGRLIIDKNSESLELGTQFLSVYDVSKDTRFGKDFIYMLDGPAINFSNDEICTLTSNYYNTNLIKKCRDLAGKWDPDSQCWVFGALVMDQVEELDYYYNSKLMNVELIFENNLITDKEAFYFKGFELAAAKGRDGGARMSKGIALITGCFGSGGSRKNWGTRVEAGTVVRLQVPEKLLSASQLQQINDNGFIIISTNKDCI